MDEEIHEQLATLRHQAVELAGKWSDAALIGQGLMIRMRSTGHGLELAMHRSTPPPTYQDQMEISRALPGDLTIYASTVGETRHTRRLLIAESMVECRAGCGRWASISKAAWAGFCTNCATERWAAMQANAPRLCEGVTG